MDDFVETTFDNRADFEKYEIEFDDGPAEIGKRKLSEYNDIMELDYTGGLILEGGKAIYTYIRHHKPEIVVETGVCNGFSTLFILSALAENGYGELYSIDLPRNERIDIDEFRDKTFEKFGSGGEYALPESKEPGWVASSHLKENWELILGKSQEKLPQLISELERIDAFLHDSEHSLPAMLFEYECAYANLSSDGIIFSDDISWNDALEIFEGERDVATGKITEQFGYIYPIK